MTSPPARLPVAAQAIMAALFASFVLSWVVSVICTMRFRRRLRAAAPAVADELRTGGTRVWKYLLAAEHRSLTDARARHLGAIERKAFLVTVACFALTFVCGLVLSAWPAAVRGGVP